MANDANSRLSNGAGSSGSNSSLLSGFGGIVGSASGIVGSLLSYDMNRDLANQRNQQAIQQWNRENAYNHPREQLKRLREAGLNPALMYENGASGLVSANSPDMAMPSPANFQGIDPLSVAQIQNLNAQTQSIEHATEREDEKQPFTLSQMNANIHHTTQMINESISRTSLNKSEEFLNNALEGKAQEDAKKSYYEWVYLSRSLEDRLTDCFNIANKHGLESAKLNEELNYLGDMLAAQLKNEQETFSLLVSQRGYYNSSAYLAREEGKQQSKYGDAASSNAHLGWQRLDMDARMFIKDMEFKVRALQAQIERWDDMTTNERLRILEDFVGDVISAGTRIYTGGLVTETIEKTSNGGNTTSTYSRKRRPK